MNKLSVNRVCFLCFLIIVSGASVNGSPILNTSPEAFPFHASVGGRIICNGILISEKFVLTPAFCIHGSQNVSVYLGYRGNPSFTSNKGEPNTKLIKSSKVIIHEAFEYLGDNIYLNNIALVELPEAITPTSTIKPGRLIDTNELSLAPRSPLNITGWYAKEDTNMKIGHVHLREQDTCRFLFGRSFLEQRELCVKWDSAKPLNFVGNPVSFNGKIIGYQAKTPSCLGKAGCSSSDVLLNIAPFLNWISQHTNGDQSMAQNNQVDILERLSHLEREMKELKALYQSKLPPVYRGIDRTEGYVEPENN